MSQIDKEFILVYGDAFVDYIATIRPILHLRSI